MIFKLIIQSLNQINRHEHLASFIRRYFYSILTRIKVMKGWLFLSLGYYSPYIMSK